MNIHPKAFRSAAWFALLSVVFGGCKDQQLPPIAAERYAQPMRAADIAASVPPYPTQWLGSRTLTVAPGVHVLGELFPSAAYAIETSEGVILIDTGVDENGVELRNGLFSVGLTVDQIRFILLTHAHYDHVFGANKLREMSGAVVCAGRDDGEVLRTADEDALFSLFPRHQYSDAPIQVDRELQDGDAIELGNVTLRVIGAPGHTPGSMCYLLEHNDQRILFSGDVIASLNFGPATYPVHISPRYRGDADAYLKTIDRLLAMEPPDLLLTGHPQQQTQKQTIRMDQSRWNRLLVPAKEELLAVIDRHRKDGADFLDGNAKEIEAGLYYLGDLDGTAVYCIASEHERIVINAPGGERLAKFLSSQFETLGLRPTEPTLVLLTSSEEACYAGLTSLETGPLVVVPGPALERLQKRGVENAISDENLAGIVDFPIQTIRLGGPEEPALAYSFAVGQRQILVTPKLPRNLTIAWTNRQTARTTISRLQPQTHELISSLASSPAAQLSYQQSLQLLGKQSPDVWLPSMPLTGQNANLYDGQWQSIIQTNLAVANLGSGAP